MKHQINDAVAEIIKVSPAAGLGGVGGLTGDDVYKWLGAIWFAVLIIDKLWSRYKIERDRRREAEADNEKQ